MLIAGATGRIGSAIAREAIARRHAVTALVRSPRDDLDPAVAVEVGEVTDPATIARLADGHDVIVSAVGGARQGNPGLVVDAAHALLEGIRRSGRDVRLAIVGGAGSLEVEPGVELVDVPGFPDVAKPGSLAQRDALAVYEREGGDVDWTYLSPADAIEPGERTGVFALGLDQLIVDDDGRSWISIEDYAVAFLDEIEQPRHRQRRFTVGYASR